MINFNNIIFFRPFISFLAFCLFFYPLTLFIINYRNYIHLFIVGFNINQSFISIRNLLTFQLIKFLLLL